MVLLFCSLIFYFLVGKFGGDFALRSKNRGGRLGVPTTCGAEKASLWARIVHARTESVGEGWGAQPGQIYLLSFECKGPCLVKSFLNENLGKNPLHIFFFPRLFPNNGGGREGEEASRSFLSAAAIGISLEVIIGG